MNLLQHVFYFFIIIAFLCGCKGKESARHSADTIVVAVSTEPQRLNPVYISDLISSSISGLIFNGLTKIDKDAKVIADLAQSWDIRDSGREIVFYLKKGILWHDGREFTSEDVLFTYKTITLQDIASPHASAFGFIKEVRAVDPYTVRVLYAEPFGSALESWSIGIVPKHILENRDISGNYFDRSPIGTGP